MSDSLPGAVDTPLEAVEETTEAPASPEASASDLSETPPSPAGEPTPDSASASLEAPAPEVPTRFQPPEGAQAFTYRVDGTDLPLKGAVAVDDWVMVPRETWDRELRPNWLGNRNTWRQERAGFERQIHDLRSGNERAQSEESIRAKALVAKVNELFSDPEKLAAAYQNWATEGPILQAKAEAEVARQQLQRYQQQEQEQARAQQEKAYEPMVLDELGTGLESVLEEMGAVDLLKGANGKPTQEAIDLYGHLRGLLEKGYPLVTAVRGPDGSVRGFQADRDEIWRLAQREVQRTQAKAVQAKQGQKVAAANRAAVAPTKPASGPVKPVAKPTQPRTPEGKFAEKQDADDWEKEFDRTQYHKQL